MARFSDDRDANTSTEEPSIWVIQPSFSWLADSLKNHRATDVHNPVKC